MPICKYVVSAAFLINISVALPTSMWVSNVTGEEQIAGSPAAQQRLARRRGENVAQHDRKDDCGDGRSRDDRDRDNGVSHAGDSANDGVVAASDLTDC
jgi:hypothetical protein